MKLLAICGSPRKGNSSNALKLIRDTFPGIDFEILHLIDLDLNPCRGCYTCVLKGESKCPLKDDRDMILGKMADADGLILATPVYSHMVSALIKNLFERLGYMAHRPLFFNKFAMSMVTYSGYGAEEALKYMDKMLSAFGFNLAPSLELQFRPGKLPEKNATLNLEKSKRAVKILVEKIERGEKNKPSLKMLIPFNVFKYVAELDKELMIFAQHPDRAWLKFVKEMPEIRNKTLALFTTYKIATGSMFRKMVNHLTDKSDPPKTIFKSRSMQLTDKNRSTLAGLINS